MAQVGHNTPSESSSTASVLFTLSDGHQITFKIHQNDNGKEYIICDICNTSIILGAHKSMGGNQHRGSQCCTAKANSLARSENLAEVKSMLQSLSDPRMTGKL